MIGPIFDALADSYRRQLLVCLLEDEFQHVPTLAESAREMTDGGESVHPDTASSRPETDGTDETRHRKHRTHLSTLVEYGFIEWDRGDQAVRRGPRFDDVRPTLELLIGKRQTLSRDCLPAEQPPLVSGQPDGRPGDGAVEPLDR